MRIQVLYTADLKFYAKAVLLTSIIAGLPFPVSQWIIPLLAKYGDEFVQDSNLLPFSPDPKFAVSTICSLTVKPLPLLSDT